MLHSSQLRPGLVPLFIVRIVWLVCEAEKDCPQGRGAVGNVCAVGHTDVRTVLLMAFKGISVAVTFLPTPYTCPL